MISEVDHEGMKQYQRGLGQDLQMGEGRQCHLEV
jgi:hypothetical protein